MSDLFPGPPPFTTPLCCFTVKMRPRTDRVGRREILKEMELGNTSAHLWMSYTIVHSLRREVVDGKGAESSLNTGQGSLRQEAKVPGFLSCSNERNIFLAVYILRCLSVLSVLISVCFSPHLPLKCFFLPAYGLGCFLNERVLFFSNAITSAADLFTYLCL